MRCLADEQPHAASPRWACTPPPSAHGQTWRCTRAPRRRPVPAHPPQWGTPEGERNKEHQKRTAAQRAVATAISRQAHAAIARPALLAECGSTTGVAAAGQHGQARLPMAQPQRCLTVSRILLKSMRGREVNSLSCSADSGAWKVFMAAAGAATACTRSRAARCCAGPLLRVIRPLLPLARWVRVLQGAAASAMEAARPQCRLAELQLQLLLVCWAIGCN